MSEAADPVIVIHSSAQGGEAQWMFVVPAKELTQTDLDTLVSHGIHYNCKKYNPDAIAKLGKKLKPYECYESIVQGVRIEAVYFIEIFFDFY